MTQGGGGDSDRRKWPRVALEAQVALSSASIEDLVSGPLLDISVGGLFIRSRTVKEIGTEVTLRIDVPAEGVRLTARGIVIRAITLDEARGVVFTALDEHARATLERLIEAAIATDG
jgi:Tfp pilus assembly protein PilZ